jgi:hypothetical protein
MNGFLFLPCLTIVSAVANSGAPLYPFFLLLNHFSLDITFERTIKLAFVSAGFAFPKMLLFPSHSTKLFVQGFQQSDNLLKVVHSIFPISSFVFLFFQLSDNLQVGALHSDGTYMNAFCSSELFECVFAQRSASTRLLHARPRQSEIKVVGPERSVEQSHPLVYSVGSKRGRTLTVHKNSSGLDLRY